MLKNLLLKVMSSKKFFATIAFIISLVVGLISISDYNVNWDEPVHFMRGQAYLHFFLTGKTNFHDLSRFDEFDKCTSNLINICSTYGYSIYQTNSYDMEELLKSDSGHPPLNGILAALFNNVFYQHLRVLGDIESYQLFILVMSALLVTLVFYWSFEEFGLFAGIISFLTISLYPLFINESHNNIKDPVESSFFILTVYAFYKSVQKKSWKWMIFSAIFSGMALGTKFNIVFLPFIVFIWLGLIYFYRLRRGIAALRINLPILLTIITYPIITVTIFFVTWPYLWSNPISNTLNIIKFYLSVGTGGNPPSGFQFMGLNTYAISFILYTTPLPILFFLTLGIFFIMVSHKKFMKPSSILWLILFIFPILRVTMPGSGIYGGVRQIMEYLPAVALLCGIGAVGLKNLLTSRIKRNKMGRSIIATLIIVVFIPVFLEIKQIHPNESFYFNQLMGGLKGATQKFAVWDTALGNQYAQGMKWVNAHAEKDAKLILKFGLMNDIPLVKIRPDIFFANYQESVFKREGEYILGLVNTGLNFGYFAQYPEKYLVPIHEIKIDGVSILRIWKNDVVHTKKGYLQEKDITSSSKISITENEILINLEEEEYVTKLLLLDTTKNCGKITGGTIYTLIDGQVWKQEVDELLDQQAARLDKVVNGVIVQYFAAVPAQNIKIVIQRDQVCSQKNYGVNIISLKDIRP